MTSQADLKNISKAVSASLKQQNVVDDDIKNRNFTHSPQLDTCHQVWRLAKDHESKSRKNNESVGQLYGEIANWVQKFIGVGDVVAQVDPVHVGLPWAAVRFVLVVRFECISPVNTPRC